MIESLASAVGAMKGLGVVGTVAAIAVEGHPMLAVVIGTVALLCWLFTPAAKHVRQWLGDTVGRKLGTISSPAPVPAVQSTTSTPGLPARGDDTSACAVVPPASISHRRSRPRPKVRCLPAVRANGGHG